MCFKLNMPAQSMGQPPALASRNPDLQNESQLAKPQKVVDEKKVTGVEYGNQKADSPTEGAGEGSDALRIKLNTGTQTASNNTGGINTGGTA